MNKIIFSFFLLDQLISIDEYTLRKRNDYAFLFKQMLSMTNLNATGREKKFSSFS